MFPPPFVAVICPFCPTPDDDLEVAPMILGGLDELVPRAGWHQCPHCFTGFTVTTFTDTDGNSYLQYESPPLQDIANIIQHPGFFVRCLACNHWSLNFTMFRSHISRHHPTLLHARFYGNFRLPSQMSLLFPVVSTNYHAFVRGLLSPDGLQAFVEQVWDLCRRPGAVTAITTLFEEQFSSEVELEWTLAASLNTSELSLWELNSATGLLSVWASLLYLLKRVNQEDAHNRCHIRLYSALPSESRLHRDHREVSYRILVPATEGYEMTFRINSWQLHGGPFWRTLYNSFSTENYYCKLCWRTIALGQQALHLEGRAHFLQFVNSVPWLYCAFCRKKFRPCQWDTHLAGRSHQSFAVYHFKRSQQPQSTLKYYQEFVHYNVEVVEEQARYLSHLEHAYVRWPHLCSRAYFSRSPLPFCPVGFEAGGALFPGPGPWRRITLLLRNATDHFVRGLEPHIAVDGYKPG